MSDFQYEGDTELLEKLQRNFAGKIVRKDLTKRIKEGANVPVYVLEYLLGMYCSSLDEDEIEAGVETVKGYWQRIMSDQMKHRKLLQSCVKRERIL